MRLDVDGTSVVVVAKTKTGAAVVLGTSVVVVAITKTGACDVGGRVDGAAVGLSVRQSPNSEAAVFPLRTHKFCDRLHPQTPLHEIAQRIGKHGSGVGDDVGDTDGGTSVVVVLGPVNAGVVVAGLKHTPHRNGQIARILELISARPKSPTEHSEEASGVHMRLSEATSQSITVMAPTIELEWSSHM